MGYNQTFGYKWDITIVLGPTKMVIEWDIHGISMGFSGV